MGDEGISPQLNYSGEGGDAEQGQEVDRDDSSNSSSSSDSEDEETPMKQEDNASQQGEEDEDHELSEKVDDEAAGDAECTVCGEEAPVKTIKNPSDLTPEEKRETFCSRSPSVQGMVSDLCRGSSARGPPLPEDGKRKDGRTSTGSHRLLQSRRRSGGYGRFPNVSGRKGQVVKDHVGDVGEVQGERRCRSGSGAIQVSGQSWIFYDGVERRW